MALVVTLACASCGDNDTDSSDEASTPPSTPPSETTPPEPVELWPAPPEPMRLARQAGLEPDVIEHFSYWMTTMLHCAEDGSDFDEMRQLGELTSLVSSEAGLTYLAEGYTGWSTS